MEVRILHHLRPTIWAKKHTIHNICSRNCTRNLPLRGSHRIGIPPQAQWPSKPGLLPALSKAETPDAAPCCGSPGRRREPSCHPTRAEFATWSQHRHWCTDPRWSYARVKKGFHQAAASQTAHPKCERTSSQKHQTQRESEPCPSITLSLPKNHEQKTIKKNTSFSIQITTIPNPGPTPPGHHRLQALQLPSQAPPLGRHHQL